MHKRIWLTLSLWLLTSLSYAHSVDAFFSVGPGFSTLKNESSVEINSVVTNNYSTSESDKTYLVVGVGVNQTLEGLFNPCFNLGLGLGGYYLNFNTIEGTEQPFVTGGTFDTLNYKFKARSIALFFESRFIYAAYDWQPYLLLGIGPSWNRLMDYVETPTDPDSSAAAIPEVFSANTEVSFAYEVGVGVQTQFFYDPCSHIQYFGSLEYRYMNFGEGELGGFPALTSSDRLHVSNLYAHTILVTFRIGM